MKTSCMHCIHEILSNNWVLPADSCSKFEETYCGNKVAELPGAQVSEYRMLRHCTKTALPSLWSHQRSGRSLMQTRCSKFQFLTKIVYIRLEFTKRVNFADAQSLSATTPEPRPLKNSSELCISKITSFSHLQFSFAGREKKHFCNNFWNFFSMEWIRSQRRPSFCDSKAFVKSLSRRKERKKEKEKKGWNRNRKKLTEMWRLQIFVAFASDWKKL